MVRMVPSGPLGMVSQNTNYWQCTMPRAGVKIILHQMNLPGGKADHACVHRLKKISSRLKCEIAKVKQLIKIEKEKGGGGGGGWCLTWATHCI